MFLTAAHKCSVDSGSDGGAGLHAVRRGFSRGVEAFEMLLEIPCGLLETGRYPTLTTSLSGFLLFVDGRAVDVLGRAARRG